MLQQHTVKPVKNKKARKRVGRGNASGTGTYSGRGCKGQGQRSGGSVPSWFEGGQTPLHQRMPKLRGFKRYGRIEYQAVNLSQLEKLKEDKISKSVLCEAGLINKTSTATKLLAHGEISRKVEVEVEKASVSAIKKIEKLGGKVVLLSKIKKAKDIVTKKTRKQDDTKKNSASSEALPAEQASSQDKKEKKDS